jgi:prepilin-type N-terminal cleavage/methylation domain-containing protein
MNSTILRSLRRAFSLVEMVVTVAVIGIVAAIAIPIYSNVTERSQIAVVEDHVELLNRSLGNFSQSCWKIPTAANNSDTADEFLVLRSLQYTFPQSASDPIGKPGSPYFSPNYDPSASSSTNEHRIRWNGRSFEVLPRGQAGSGILFRGADDIKRTPYSFPSGYKPEGA